MSAIELAMSIVVIIVSVKVVMAVAMILAETTTRLIGVVLPLIVVSLNVVCVSASVRSATLSSLCLVSLLFCLRHTPTSAARTRLLQKPVGIP